MNSLLNMYRMLPIFNSRLCWLAGGLLAAHFAVAQDAGTTLYTRYPSGSIATVEAAESAHEQAASEKARIELQFAQDEQACGGVFFVSACREKAKERRRAALEPVRLVQIEADMAMRRMRVADKDKALTDKLREKTAAAVRIERDAQQKAQQTAQARNAENDRERVENEQLHAQDAGPSATGQARQARMQLEAAADAQKRAANVAAYDRKITEAQAHQRDIAARKAEKDRKRKIQPPAVQPAATGLPLPAAPALAAPKP